MHTDLQTCIKWNWRFFAKKVKNLCWKLEIHWKCLTLQLTKDNQGLNCANFPWEISQIRGIGRSEYREFFCTVRNQFNRFHALWLNFKCKKRKLFAIYHMEETYFLRSAPQSQQRSFMTILCSHSVASFINSTGVLNRID